ncbi:MAG: SDR family oxidoreductase [Parvibaculum sp.]
MSGAKRAFVTGAAGGLGRALCADLAASGYQLTITDRAGTLDPSCFPSGTELMEADLCIEADLARLSSRLADEALPVDLLVNNAGIGVPGSVASISADLLSRHITINLTAPMLLSQAAAQAMIKRGRGHIFSIVSLAGIFPLKDSAAYTASKFGLRGFKAALALELAPYGVKVGGLYPSAIDTQMLREEMSHPDGSPLNFAGSANPLSAEATSKAVMRALANGALETQLPRGEGLMAGLVMSFPRLLSPVFSHLERQGNRKKRAFLESLGATPD